MKKPYTTKIPGRTVSQVMVRFDAVLSRQVNVCKVKFFEAQVTAEAITNAIVLHFMDLPEDQQDAILFRYVAVFAGIVSDVTVEQKDAPPSSDATSGGKTTFVEGKSTRKQKARRK